MERAGPAETIREHLRDLSFAIVQSGKFPFIPRNFRNDVIFCAGRCLI